MKQIYRHAGCSCPTVPGGGSVRGEAWSQVPTGFKCLANNEATKWKMVDGRDMRSTCENLALLSYCLVGLTSLETRPSKCGWNTLLNVKGNTFLKEGLNLYE